MKRLVKMVAGLAVAGAILFAVVALYRGVFTDPEVWYVQVDNTCVTEAADNANDFPYHYELSAADARGATRVIGFDTARELRGGAYLRLEVLALRGVRSWEEVAWDEIPAAAQEEFMAPGPDVEEG